MIHRLFWPLLIVVVTGLLGVGTYLLWPLPDPDVLWEQARAAMSEKRFDDANRLIILIGKIRPPTPADWLVRAQVAMALNKIDEAFEDLKQIPDDHKAGATARMLAGQLELRRNRARYADEFLKKAIALDPKLVQARRELVFLYGFQLRRPELMAQFTELSKITALTFDDVFIWCLARGAAWEPSEAAAMLQKFLDADPEDRDSRLALIENRRREQKFDVTADLLSALPTDDRDAMVLKARIALGRNDDEALQQILADGPADDPDLARIRARFAQIARENDEAIRFYRLALAVEPDDRDCLRGLGQCLSTKGETELGEKYLQEAKKYDDLASLVERASPGPGRNDPQLVFDLGNACEAVGRYAEALAWFKLILSRDPLNTQAQTAIYRLKQRQSSDSSVKSLE